MAPSVSSQMVERIRAFQRSAKANKRCADCSEVGPIYICSNFQTFVCQTCSGIHREFGHKIKSITLSDWTLQEVQSIEEGGNEKAAHKWLARWKAANDPEPSSNEPERVREFLRKKYEHKLWRRLPTAAQTTVEQPSVQLPASPPDAGPASARGQRPLHSASPVPNFGTTALLDLDLATPASQPQLPAAVVPAAADWTADFSNASASASSQATGNVTSTAALPTGDQWVADFSDRPDQASCNAASASTGGVQSGLLGLDLNIAGSAQAQTSAGPSPAVASTTGEQLRDAVLNGSSDVVRRLFEQHGPQVAPGAATPRGAMGGLQWPNMGEDASRGPGPIQNFYIGDDDMPCQSAVPPVTPRRLSVGTQAMLLQQVPSTDPHTVLASEQRLSPEQCTQFQAAEAAQETLRLKQQMNSEVAPASNGIDCAAADATDAANRTARGLSQEATYFALEEDDELEDVGSTGQFDDLILAFQKKNPVLGFDL